MSELHPLAPRDVSWWTIPSLEVVEQMRGFLRGEIAGEWRGNEVDPHLHLASGWVLTFFNDCGSLDYLDTAVAPNGRSQDAWCREGEHWYDPAYELTFEERDDLEARMIAAARQLAIA
jgi:hypothetical protein